MSDLECPKAMRHGPCGGVRPDGSCEVDPRPCPFLGRALGPGPRQHAEPFTAPALLVDVRGPRGWTGDIAGLWSATAETLTGATALLGEHVDNPVHLDDAGRLAPEAVIEILADAEVPVVATVTGRDRSLEEAAMTVASFCSAGAAAVHCVTGDHPAAMGIDRPVEFGAEGVTLTEVAALAGTPVSVGESPASPGPRAARLLLKQRAGASMCVLNHGGDVADVVRFADECRAAGVTMPLIAPVPMIGDPRSALALAEFPGLRLPAGLLDAIIESPDPLAEGIASAAAMVAAIAASGRFAGVNLSGSAGAGDPWERLRFTRRFLDAVEAAWRAESVSSPTVAAAGRWAPGRR